MDYKALLELAKSRRTIRAIKSDPIDDQTVAKLLEAARWAPTGFNMQPCEFVVTFSTRSRRGTRFLRTRMSEAPRNVSAD